MSIVNNKLIRITATVVLLIAIAFGIDFFSKDQQYTASLNENTESIKEVGCTRATRLDNEPQYDRALSLIQQRVDENNKWWDKYGDDNAERNKYFHFPPELTNCIKISEETFTDSTEVEGYFTLNSKEIKIDYYPITVSSDYSSTDDVVTALLLSHEITHVQQYINSINEKKSLSCVDDEIDAFTAQLDFYVILNDEENSSVYNRIHNDKGLHSQLQMIDAMTTINRESGCNILDSNCNDVNLRNKLREMITEDSYYRKQCGL